MNKNKPSRTAYKVALAIVALGAKPASQNILPPGILQATEGMLIASGIVSSRIVRWHRSSLIASIYEAFDWMLPGEFEAIADRKVFCERQVRYSIGEGATQTLVLGAGYDTLGWRLAPEFPKVNFFEIDHPTTSRFKARGVESLGPRKNLFIIEEDLGKKSLKATLMSNQSWDINAQTVIVAEGLLMYLTTNAVEELFRQCAEITGTGSRFAFSYIPSGSDGKLDVGRWTGVALWLQKAMGEPWIWSIRPDELEIFLKNIGWTNRNTGEETNNRHGVEFLVAAQKLG
jgi:methyltransferase (TIGR00027 family)